MGNLFGSNDPVQPVSQPLPVVPQTIRQPRLADEGIRKARTEEERKRKAAAQRGGTLITGPAGLQTTATTTKKTLTGQ